MDPLREILKFYGEMGAEFLHLPGSDPRADLAELNREILQCRRCRLHESKTHYVPGEGSNRPDILFIGEGPGETEDQFGRPFIGKAGQLLDKIIQKMGLRREDVFIGNVVKCRPPNNREPLKDEVETCLPYLLRQIAILQPKVIVCLGRVALNNLLGTSHSMGRIRGQFLSFNGIPLMATYHPAYILHKKDKEEISKAKWEIWEDMQKVLALVRTKRP
jgi:uracil-DNA glycosylase family 4